MSAIAPPDEGWQTAWPTEPAGPPPQKRRLLQRLSELPAMIAIFILAALLMKTFLLQLFFIPSESMDPTLHGCQQSPTCSGDRVVVNKLAYRVRDPRRGEIAVFVAEEDKSERSFFQKFTGLFTDGLGITAPRDRDFIKRIIGLPGDTIEVTSKAVFVTPAGTKKKIRLVEPYANIEGGTNFSLQEPFTVPKDMFFVMGDNRNNSSDSRTSLGPIRRSDLIGKAFVRIWPGKKPGQGWFERFKRIGLLEEGVYPAPLQQGRG